MKNIIQFVDNFLYLIALTYITYCLFLIVFKNYELTNNDLGYLIIASLKIIVRYDKNEVSN